MTAVRAISFSWHTIFLSSWARSFTSPAASILKNGSQCSSLSSGRPFSALFSFSTNTGGTPSLQAFSCSGSDCGSLPAFCSSLIHLRTSPYVFACSRCALNFLVSSSNTAVALQEEPPSSWMALLPCSRGSSKVSDSPLSSVQASSVGSQSGRLRRPSSLCTSTSWSSRILTSPRGYSVSNCASSSSQKRTAGLSRRFIETLPRTSCVARNLYSPLLLSRTSSSLVRYRSEPQE
mmetsp:Transcript_2685/g.7369  ORF Transcript_2685/g.7369 Transcript_2685/m.7369 type:complete len:234 (+) Transcript_2685:547-1248(+)